MKRTYQRKLTFSFLAIFALFTAGIVIFEQQRARIYKTEALEERLDSYADIAAKYISLPENRTEMEGLIELLPGNIRITLIALDGTVAYDNLIADASFLENHSGRPEIEGAKQEGKGTFIRTSASNNLPYLYYAKYYGDSYIRVALPYDIEVRSFLKPDNGFLYFIAGLLVIGFLFIYLAGSRFGKSVRQLRDFSLAVSNSGQDVEMPRFPKDELGEISQQIARDFSMVRDSGEQLRQEREKLLQHVQSSAEGICFFDSDGTVAFYNGLFLQYLNTLSRNVVSSSAEILKENAFLPVRVFLENRDDENYFETRVTKQGKDFLVRVNIFDDQSFEIILNDITSQEKTRRLKQEMTGNIAHELRTPVTSIRGYLETVIDNDLGREKERDFLVKAYQQTKNLSELISDMSLLTKIEQGQGSFSKEDVRIAEVVEKVKTDLREELSQKNITFESHVGTDTVIYGNANLLYSIFRNLTDNVIRHAGNGVRIEVRKLGEKDGYIHLSFADTGVGIGDETMLARLFERFYRITEGRTRDTGGSGLGLSIVKNAVLFHGGSITVKNRDKGGLEFIFDLKQKKQ